MKQRLHSKDEEVKVLQAENQDLKMHVRKLEAVTSQTDEDVNDLEQYGRRECLEFQGLAWNMNENTDDLILRVSKMVGVDLKAEEISVSHRLSPASDKNPRNLPSLRGSAPGRPETLYSAKDIGCALTTRPTLKDAYSLMKLWPRSTNDASTSACNSRKRRISSSYGPMMEWPIYAILKEPKQWQ